MENQVVGIVVDLRRLLRGVQMVELLQEQGIISVLMPAKKETSKSLQWLEPLQPLQCVRLWVDSRKEWLYVREVVVEERFEGLRKSYSAIANAQKMRQVIKKLARPGHPCPQLYQAFIAHLKILEKISSHEKVLASFLAKALWAEGYLDGARAPHCHVCHVTDCDLWNTQGEWHCDQHRKYGARWNLYQQQMLQMLVANKKMELLRDETHEDIPKLLLKWVDAL